MIFLNFIGSLKMQQLMERAKVLRETYPGITYELAKTNGNTVMSASYNSLVNDTKNYFRLKFPDNEGARTLGEIIVYMYIDTDADNIHFKMPLTNQDKYLFEQLEPFSQYISIIVNTPAYIEEGVIVIGSATIRLLNF